MKEYKNRNELSEDVKLIKSIFNHEIDYRNKIIHILFNRWMATSPDSPWQDKIVENESKDDLHKLVRINIEGTSSEWSGEHTVFHEIDKENIVHNPYHSIRHI